MSRDDHLDRAKDRVTCERVRLGRNLALRRSLGFADAGLETFFAAVALAVDFFFPFVFFMSGHDFLLRCCNFSAYKNDRGHVQNFLPLVIIPADPITFLHANPGKTLVLKQIQALLQYVQMS